MEFFEWLAHVVLFFIVLKVAQVVFWNVRKVFYIHPWLIEAIMAVLVVTALSMTFNSWWMTSLLAVFFGVIRGDQEQGEEAVQRQLL